MGKKCHPQGLTRAEKVLPLKAGELLMSSRGSLSNLRQAPCEMLDFEPILAYFEPIFRDRSPF